jgi:hypothetical protein
MAELHPEQWGLTPLDLYVIGLVVGLAPPLLIRFVLVRRPIGKGWAIVVAALFWALGFVVFTALSDQGRAHGAFVLVAIISFLFLAAGKKDEPPDVVESESAGPEKAPPDPGAVSQDADGKREDPLPIGFLLIDDSKEVGEENAAAAEIPQFNARDASSPVDDDEIHRYDIAWRELEAGNQHRGLWARAFAINDGDEVKTRVQYLKERTEFLKEQERRQEAERRTRELREQEIRKEKERQHRERMALLKQEELKKAEERQARELRERELQRERDRLGKEQKERLSREIQRQKEEHQHRDLVQRIAQKQSDKVNLLREGINRPDKWKEFKLISAAQFGSDEYVFILLAAGANPLLRDGFGHSARDYAKQKGRTEIARHLEIAERLWKQKSQSIQSNAA